MVETLKPCPFCGGEVSIALIKDEDARWFVTRGVSDESCGCRVFMESRRFNGRDSEEEIERIKKELVAAWNRRAERTCSVERVVYPDGEIEGYMCVACGYSFMPDIPNFCPNCGAKVVE